MVLEIRTTGVEDYLDGGSANIQMLVIGGPGAGKTRMSSFWPKPFLLDCESGRASVADRKLPYVEIKGSGDMLSALTYLKTMERTPRADRPFSTVIVDTLDGYQRKIKDEWLLRNPTAESFRGFDAWGYLDTKMQMLMTRLLNLDFNVIVLVHYKDKVVKGKGDDEDTHELMLQLQGDVKDTAFNDFDLVGWLGTYWAAEDGQRVQKRGLTFESTPDKPFLKDRFHVTPKWMEVKFAESDYGQLFEAWASKLDDLDEGEAVGSIPDAEPAVALPVGPLNGGALPPVDPKDVPLVQFTKVELLGIARSEGVEVRGNMLKNELIEVIEAHRAKAAAAPEPEQEVLPVEQQPTVVSGEADLQPVASPAPEADGATSVQDADVALDPADPYRVAQAATEQAVETVKAELGATEVEPEPEAPSTAPAAEVKQEVSPENACEVCGVDLAGEDQNYVRLAVIKHRKRLCKADYVAANNNK